MTQQNDPNSQPPPPGSGRPPIEPGAAQHAYQPPPPPPPPAGYYPPPQGYAPPPPPPPVSKITALANRLAVGLISSILLLSITANIYFAIIFSAAMRGASETVVDEGDDDKRIVIIPVEGLIDESTAVFVHGALKTLREDKKKEGQPAAIVLRVDSGGGTVSASDRIWHDIEAYRKATEKDGKKIPFIASYGSLAASGGVYVSVNSDYIIAEPTCVTGSIGVIAPAFSVDKMLEKIGVTPETITATPSTRKDVANSITRPWNADDRATVRRLLDNACELFIQKVIAGRKGHLSEAEVRVLANGEIFTAAEAKENKLIDEIGYLDAAVEKAKSAAGFTAKDKVLVTRLAPYHPGGILGLFTASEPPQAITSTNLRRWATELGMPRLEFVMQP
jgi:protease-4